ncbi:InlB B-repeat-containing protein [Streptococcus sp. H49]|uniref:InlB B-repeat-containing protein n=1 Tax=Streptococcus huangxiaojuni TaxID=3237239 RepID=UPI0034A4779D
MVKKIITLFFLMNTLFVYGVSAVEAAEIEGHISLFPNETARNFVTGIDGKGYGTQVSWVSSAYFDGINATVEDSSGQVIYSGLSGSAGRGTFRIPDLPVGTYTVTLLDVNDKVLPLPFSKEQLENPNSPFVLQDEMTAVVEITEESEVKKLYWIMVSKSKQVMSYSLHGEFPEGSQGVDQNGAAVSYRVWYRGGDWPQSFTSTNNRQFISFPGVLVSDTLGMYAGYSTIPTLSAEEQAYGWTFQGWRVNGSDRIYTLEEIARITITEDIQLEAVWEAPNHNVSFVTDIEKGAIAGQSSVNYNIEGNSSTVSDATANTLPEVNAKEGYTFLGWYVDNSTNLVSDSDILATSVQKDLVYYAKYKENTPESKGDKGDTGDIGPKGDKGEKGDTGDAGPKGDKGEKGDTGDTGSKGDKGEKGDTGDTGSKEITPKTIGGIAVNSESSVNQVTKNILPNTGDKGLPALSILGIVSIITSIYIFRVSKSKK